MKRGQLPAHSPHWKHARAFLRKEVGAADATVFSITCALDSFRFSLANKGRMGIDRWQSQWSRFPPAFSHSSKMFYTHSCEVRIGRP